LGAINSHAVTLGAMVPRHGVGLHGGIAHQLLSLRAFTPPLGHEILSGVIPWDSRSARPAAAPLRAAAPGARPPRAAAGGRLERQAQLDHAARHGDLEACIYLVRRDGGGGARLDPAQLRALVGAAFHGGRPALALDLVRALPRPHPRHYSLLMKECLRRKDLITLGRVLAARRAAGWPPDAWTASAGITALGAAGRPPAEALAALRAAWREPGCRRVEVCNAAIGACAAAGDWAGAQEAVGVLRAAGLAPDVVTYNSLIKAAGAARRMPQALALHAEMGPEGVEPTPVTYTALFSAAARNRYDDMAWLLQVRRAWVGARMPCVRVAAVGCAPRTRYTLHTQHPPRWARCLACGASWARGTRAETSPRPPRPAPPRPSCPPLAARRRSRACAAPPTTSSSPPSSPPPRAPPPRAPSSTASSRCSRRRAPGGRSTTPSTPRS
jgi:pentatricopeptide repeat protein